MVQELSPIESSAFKSLKKVIIWFITLRWIACIGVSMVLILSYFIFHFQLQYKILSITTFILILLNLTYSFYFYRYKKQYLQRREIHQFFQIQIFGDYLLLLVLVYFSGFMENPLIYFFVFHIIITSFLFSSRIVTLYTAILVLVIGSISFLQYFYIIPSYPLFTSYGIMAPIVRLVQTAGFSALLVITAYLTTSTIKKIDTRGKQFEIELNKYKSLDKIKSNFILQVTHELRGPLAAISGFHEMILRGITGEIQDQTRQIITKADRRTDNLLIIIGEMIDFAYIKSSDDITFATKELSVRKIISENISNITTKAEQEEVHLSVACPKHLRIKTNSDLINIILGNLLFNAIKYTQPGGNVSLIASEKGHEVHIVVEDTGIGVCEDEIEKVFDEFYRSRRAREMEKDGTGLGLSIVKKAVDALHGRIIVHSKEGKGSSFHVFLPAYIDTGQIPGGENAENTDNR
ncbi:MAG: HAMP domain-containing sensor histidine kinase [Spirochaetia bacterium]|jgi:signal transduction histidine kinase|nr:HAMP domain-containing sensor histidine kinase [Spirochaetia bacterium]